MAMIAGASACAVAETAPPVTVTVTGRVREVNGVDQVPRGLFGVHAMNGLTDAMAAEWGIESVRTIEVDPSGQPRRPGTGQGHGFIPEATDHVVECWYDRFRPALQLTDPESWEQSLRERAARWAAGVESLPYDIALEFWNEPYLNWAGNPGSNFDGRFYTREGEVVLRQGVVQPTLQWTTRLAAFDPANGRVDYVATRYMPKGTVAGQTFTWRKLQWEAREVPWVFDTQQPVSWWSGPYNRGLYHEMVSVVGPAMKEANPDARLVVGWGFHLFQDRWKAWDLLHRPLIDHAITWIDGYNEHHYGGDTRAVAGSYEVAYAYALAAHGKRLAFYNTEAGGFLDPERPGSGAATGPDGKDKAVREQQGTAYMLRDVIHLLDVCPDKAVARAAHMPDVYGGKEAFKLLKPLRGTLMEAVSGSPDVWVVASAHDGELVVAAYNDTTTPRDVQLVGAGAACDDPVRTIAPRSATVWRTTLEGDLAARARAVTTQYVADRARQDIAPGTTLQLTVALPAAALTEATQARIKLVQAPWSRPKGEAWRATLNGREVALQLPHAGGWIAWTGMDVTDLREVNTFEFACDADAPHPAAVDALSIELIRHE